MGELSGERCDICGGVLAAQTTDFEFKRDGRRILVEGVPADVCQQCGEKYIDAETMRRIEQVIEHSTIAPTHYINVPVYEFA